MIRVTCAVIRNDENEVLIVQRGEESDHPFKWEFPGGKVNPGETEEDCIIREIREELSMDIVIVSRLGEVEYDYGHKSIVLIPFVCDTLDDLPFLSEHIAFRWMKDEELSTVDFSEADVLVVGNYLRYKGVTGKVVHREPTESDLADDSEVQAMVNNLMSMKEAEWMATSAIENPALLRILLEYSYSSDTRLAFRSSWILTKVSDRFPAIMDPFLERIIESLPRIENESTLRSFLRIISFTGPEKIKKYQHGRLADFCFNALASGLSAIAIKAYSMEILFRLSMVYPELAVELSASIKNLLDEGSAGITSRGRTILRKLGEMPME